jgi:hypothetical protein
LLQTLVTPKWGAAFEEMLCIESFHTGSASFESVAQPRQRARVRGMCCMVAEAGQDERHRSLGWSAP